MRVWLIVFQGHRVLQSKRHLAWTAALLLGLALSSHATATTPEKTCRAPDDLATFRHKLPAVQNTLFKGTKLRIAALGSSSTSGTGATSKDKRYPRQLETFLSNHIAQSDVEVINYGRGGTLASQMLKRLMEEILPKKPGLVVWQTGVNDAIRNVPLLKFRATLLKGISLMHEQGIDVVLMDPQYFPGQVKYKSYDAYVDLMRDVAAETSVPLLRRHALMQHLVVSKQFEFDEILAKDRFHLNDTSYACVGHVLGQALLRSIE